MRPRVHRVCFSLGGQKKICPAFVLPHLGMNKQLREGRDRRKGGAAGGNLNAIEIDKIYRKETEGAL